MSADAIPGENLCDRPVDSIVFDGNRVTKPQVLIREINQKIDSPCSIDLIVDSTQSIMNLGLFSKAEADLSLTDDQLQLRFTVKEKLHYLLIPRISRTSDAEIRVGAQLRFDNFLGRMHEMRITSESRKEDDGSGPGGYIHRIKYNIPRFFGSNHGLGFELASDRRKVNFELNGTQFGTGQSETNTVGLMASRWVNQTSGVQGLRYYFGVRYRERKIGLSTGGVGPYTGGHDTAAVMGIENKQIRQDLYRRRGSIFGASLSFSNKSTGSDFEYTKADVYAAAYIPLASGIRNINLLGRIGFSDGAAFGEKTYSIAGGEMMRGLKDGVTSGNVMALLNIEYLHAWFEYPQWRIVLFGDIGNVYEKNELSLLKLRARGGVGFRFKFMSLSNTDLRVDLAWDADRERLQTYVSSNLTF